MRLPAGILGIVRSQLAGRAVIRRILGNSGWLFADQLWRMLLSLVAGVWVARYLGPVYFGRLSYALAFVAVATPLASLGLQSVLVRDFVRDRAGASTMAGTGVVLKLMGGAVVLVGCSAAAWFSAGTGDGTIWLVAAVAAGSVFQCLDIVDFWMQAEDRYRDSALVKSVAATAAAGVKVALILGKAPLMAFAAMGALEILFCGVGWLVVWRAAGASFRGWSSIRACLWLRETWPVIVAAVAVQVQAQFDQVLIGHMLTDKELGQYAAAMRLVVAMSFVPVVFHAAASPEVARAKLESEALYFVRLHRLYRGMVVIGVLGALVLALFPRLLVHTLLGAQFDGAAVLLPLMGLRLVLTGLGVARGLFVANEGLFRFAMVSAISGAVVSLSLNFWWIPRWGLWGAVAASFASLAVTTFAVDALVPAMRRNCGLMIRALVMPWRGLQR